MRNLNQLEVIVIPTGNRTESERRTWKALEEYRKNPSKRIIVSGTEEDLFSQYGRIHEILIGGGVREHEIEKNNARNTLENVINSLKNLGGDVKIVSNKTHLARFRRNIDYLKGPIIPEGAEEYALSEVLNVEYIPVGSESITEKIYGLLAFFNENYKLSKGINNALKIGEENSLGSIKDVFNDFYDKFMKKKDFEC